MKILQKSRVIFLVVALFAIAVPAMAANTSYQWVSSDGDPFGLSGTIVLNSSSGTGGTYASVVSISISDEFASYSVNLTSDTLYDFIPASPNGGIEWGPAQITQMYLAQETPDNSTTAYEAVGSYSTFQDEIQLQVPVSGTHGDYDGEWVATSSSSSVPDESLTAMSLLFSVVILMAARGYASSCGRQSRMALS